MKYFALDEWLLKRLELKQEGKRLVWVNGVFDLLHEGHRTLLQAARAMGDFLVVVVNDDETTKQLKGPGRPVKLLETRVNHLEALAEIDAIIVLTGIEPSALIGIVQPEICVKGDEYAEETGKPMPERAVVTEYGGEIRYIPMVEGVSTTLVIREGIKKRWQAYPPKLADFLNTLPFPLEEVTVLTAWDADPDESLTSIIEQKLTRYLVLWDLLQFLTENDIRMLAKRCEEANVHIIMKEGEDVAKPARPFYIYDDHHIVPPFIASGYSTYTDEYPALTEQVGLMLRQDADGPVSIMIRPGAIGFTHHGSRVLEAAGSRVIQCGVLPEMDHTMWGAFADLEPEVFIISALAIDPKHLQAIHDSVSCLIICDVHSDLSYIHMVGHDTMKRFMAYWKITKMCDRLRLASPRAQTAELFNVTTNGRGLWLPNPYTLPEHTQPAHNVIEGELNVGIFARFSHIKNFLGQLGALAMFAVREKIRVTVHMLISEETVLLRECFQGTLSFCFHEWVSPKDFADSSRRIDIGMEVSFSETFNYLSLDHMAQGVPCLCGPSILHGDPRLTVQPDDYEGMARCLTWCLENYNEASASARRKAEEVAQLQTKGFLQTLGFSVS